MLESRELVDAQSQSKASRFPWLPRAERHTTHAGAAGPLKASDWAAAGTLSLTKWSGGTVAEI